MKKHIMILMVLTVLLSLSLCSCGAQDIKQNQETQDLQETPGATELLPEVTSKPEYVDFANGSFDVSSVTITVKLEAGEAPLLDRFTQLQSADLSGSRCYEEILAYHKSHPQVALRLDVILPDRRTLAPDTHSVDLSSLKHSEAADTLICLQLLPELQTVDLGHRPDEPGEDCLSWEDVGSFQSLLPDVQVDYRFTLYGKEFSVLDEQMILSHRKMRDQGEAVRQVLPYMTACRFLDMDSCGVDNEHMAAIRDDFPEIKVVWRVWFGDVYTCRTDVTRILASFEGSVLNDETSDGLYYCTDVVYMDIGHSQLHDLSFLYNMPKLEVLIVACAPWTDATPIGSLENLEYLEILSTLCEDVTPLSQLHNLKHLNMGNCNRIRDITPLYGMTQLERLWIGCMDPIPAEQKEKIREMLPDTVINTTTRNHKSEGWCKDEYANNVPRYALLREQFGDYQQSVYATSWNDILYYKSLDELTEDELARIMP